MIRKHLPYKATGLLLVAILSISSLTGCSMPSFSKKTEEPVTVTGTSSEETDDKTQVVTIEEQSMPMGLSEELEEDAYKLPETVKIGAVRGISAITLAYLMDNANMANNRLNYEFIFNDDESVITDLMKSGEVDVAFLSPLNAIVSTYETDGAIKVIGISALSDLYVVTGDSEIALLSDLGGKTVYISGRGTAMDCAVRNLLETYGVETELQYLDSESEVAAAIQEDMSSVGIMSVEQAVQLSRNNDAFNLVLSLASCWNSTPSSMGSQMLSQVMTARSELIAEYPDAIDVFLNEYGNALIQMEDKSAEDSAEMLLRYGIADDCGYVAYDLGCILPVCLKNTEMQVALDGYYNVIYQMDATLFGERLPDSGCYYINPETEAPTAP